MGLEYMGLEENFSIPALVKTAEAWEGGFLAPAKVEEETADDIVQAVGGFGAGDTGLARHAFYDIRLLHSDSKLAMRHAGSPYRNEPNFANVACFVADTRTKKSENRSERDMN